MYLTWPPEECGLKSPIRPPTFRPVAPHPSNVTFDFSCPLAPPPKWGEGQEAEPGGERGTQCHLGHRWEDQGPAPKQVQ